MITFDPAKLALRQAELERLMSEPGFWDDQERAQRMSTDHARVSRRLERYDRLEREFEDARGVVASIAQRTQRTFWQGQDVAIAGGHGVSALRSLR